MKKVYSNLIEGSAKLAVVGLGYVGLPLAHEFSKHVEVVGFDIDEKKIELYKNGTDPTMELGNNILRNSKICFSSDPQKLKDCSCIIVAVPTPVDESNYPDLSYIENACRIIGKNISKGTIVVFESTVYPGVTEDICLPVIERESGLRCGTDWSIAYSPERVNPGDKVNTVSNVVKIVAGFDSDTTSEIEKIYRIVCKDVYRVSDIKTAEAVKLVENTQRDINIAFMNEVSDICNGLGIDTDAVIAGMNTKWNSLGFRPGLVGGHCIGVDSYYLKSIAEKLNCESKLVNDARMINNRVFDNISKRVVCALKQSGNEIAKAKILVLGITFKENCPDIRNSQVVELIRSLSELGADVYVSDPYADRNEVKNRTGIQLADLDEIPKVDCVIVAVGHKEYRSMHIGELKALFRDRPDDLKILFDVKSLYRLDELTASKMKYMRL